MPELLSRLLAIILLRQGPQDLPAGRSTLLASLGLYMLVAAISLNTGRSLEHPTLVLLLASGLPLLLVWIVLRLRQRPARWAQTLSALYGTSALLSLANLPLNLQASAEPAAPLVLFSLLIFLWSFMVDAHIWRHALDTSLAGGMAVTVLLFIFSFGFISSVAGPL